MYLNIVELDMRDIYIENSLKNYSLGFENKI